MHKTFFSFLKIYTKGRDGESFTFHVIFYFSLHIFSEINIVGQKVRLVFPQNELSDLPNIRCMKKIYT